MAGAVMMTVSLLIGVVFVGSVPGWVWMGERYRLTLEEFGPVERAQVAREAEVLPVEKERAVEAALRMLEQVERGEGRGEG